MITGYTDSRLDEVKDLIGRLVIGENGVLSEKNGTIKYKIGLILYETKSDGTTIFTYLAPNRPKEENNFIGVESNYIFQNNNDNVFFRNPNFSVFERFLNLELLTDNDIDAFPNNFF